MKRVVSLLLLGFGCWGLVGCSGGSGTDGSGSGERQFISLGTAPPGGAFFPVGGAIADVLNDNKGTNNWEATAESTRGTQENIRRLASGEIDLGMANAAISYFAVRGTEGWDQAYPIRSVMTLAPNIALFITPRSSGVSTIEDLRGKRIAVGPAGAGFEFFIRPILAAHGLTYDDFTPLNAGQTPSVDMLADGSAAAAFLGGAVPTASITQASASQDILLIPYDEAAMDRLVADFPFFNRATIPAGTYRGQDAEYSGMNVGSMHLITSADKSEDLIYEITKTIYEAREQVVAKHAAGRAINPKNVVRDTGTEFHPGAIRYYREIGIWPED